MNTSNQHPNDQRPAINPPPRRRRESAPEIIPPNDGEDAITPPAATYEVGYGKPPLHTRFQKGTSGNLKGRPRGAKGLNTLARDTLTSKVRVRTADGEKRMSKMEAVLQKTIELAMKGNARAIMMLFNLYRPAVPDLPAPENEASHNNDLSDTDIEILSMMRDEFRRELGEGS